VRHRCCSCALLKSLIGRARAYVALGRLRDALADYDRVLFLKPNLTEIAKERDNIKVTFVHATVLNFTQDLLRKKQALTLSAPECFSSR
jgi:hypothetical protein